MEEQNPKEQIESSQNPVDEPIQEPQKPNLLSSKWLKIGIGTLLVILVLAGTFILGKNSMNKNQAATIIAPTKTETPTQTPDSQMSKFKPEDMGISISLPSDFAAYCQTKSSCAFTREKGLGIAFGNNFITIDKGEESPIILGYFSDMSIGSTKIEPGHGNASGYFTYTRLANQVIGGFPARVFENKNPWESSKGTIERKVFVDNGSSSLYIVAFFGSSILLDELNDVLSSIKFTDSAATQSFLEIREYGVKFALTDDIKDAYYVFETANNVPHAILRVHSLDSETYCNSKLNDGSYGIAALSRVGKDEIDQRTGKKFFDSGTGSIIGNYYYFIELSQAVCSQNTSNQTIETNARKAFGEASKTITQL